MQSTCKRRVIFGFLGIGLSLAVASYGQGKRGGSKSEPTFEALFGDDGTGDGKVQGDGDIYTHGLEGVSYKNFLLDLDPGANTSSERFFVFDFSDVVSGPESPVVCDSDPTGWCDIRDLDFADPESIDYRFALRSVEAFADDETGSLYGLRCDEDAPDPADPAPDLLDMVPDDDDAARSCIRGRVNFRLARFGQVNDELLVRCGRLDWVQEGSIRDQRGTDDVRVECTGESDFGEGDQCAEWKVTPFADSGAERLICRMWDNVLGKGKKSTLTLIGDFNIPFEVTITRLQ